MIKIPKTVKTFGIVLMLFISFPVCGYAQEQSQDDAQWLKVTDNNYIDAEGIVGTEDIYGFTFLLKSYNKGQYEAVDDTNIWYTLSQYTIDCGKHTYKIGMMDSYGYQNNFVTGDYNKYSEFQPIVSGTAVSSVSNKLCRM